MSGFSRLNLHAPHANKRSPSAVGSVSNTTTRRRGRGGITKLGTITPSVPRPVKLKSERSESSSTTLGVSPPTEATGTRTESKSTWGRSNTKSSPSLSPKTEWGTEDHWSSSSLKGNSSTRSPSAESEATGQGSSPVWKSNRYERSPDRGSPTYGKRYSDYDHKSGNRNDYGSRYSHQPSKQYDASFPSLGDAKAVKEAGGDAQMHQSRESNYRSEYHHRGGNNYHHQRGGNYHHRGGGYGRNHYDNHSGGGYHSHYKHRGGYRGRGGYGGYPNSNRDTPSQGYNQPRGEGYNRYHDAQPNWHKSPQQKHQSSSSYHQRQPFHQQRQHHHASPNHADAQEGHWSSHQKKYSDRYASSPQDGGGDEERHWSSQRRSYPSRDIGEDARVSKYGGSSLNTRSGDETSYPPDRAHDHERGGESSSSRVHQTSKDLGISSTRGGKATVSSDDDSHSSEKLGQQKSLSLEKLNEMREDARGVPSKGKETGAQKGYRLAKVFPIDALEEIELDFDPEPVGSWSRAYLEPPMSFDAPLPLSGLAERIREAEERAAAERERLRKLEEEKRRLKEEEEEKERKRKLEAERKEKEEKLAQEKLRKLEAQEKEKKRLVQQQQQQKRDGNVLEEGKKISKKPYLEHGKDRDLKKSPTASRQSSRQQSSASQRGRRVWSPETSRQSGGRRIPVERESDFATSGDGNERIVKNPWRTHAPSLDERDVEDGRKRFQNIGRSNESFDEYRARVVEAHRKRMEQQGTNASHSATSPTGSSSRKSSGDKGRHHHHHHHQDRQPSAKSSNRSTPRVQIIQRPQSLSTKPPTEEAEKVGSTATPPKGSSTSLRENKRKGKSRNASQNDAKGGGGATKSSQKRGGKSKNNKSKGSLKSPAKQTASCASSHNNKTFSGASQKNLKNQERTERKTKPKVSAPSAEEASSTYQKKSETQGPTAPQKDSSPSTLTNPAQSTSPPVSTTTISAKEKVAASDDKEKASLETSGNISKDMPSGAKSKEDVSLKTTKPTKRIDAVPMHLPADGQSPDFVPPPLHTNYNRFVGAAGQGPARVPGPLSTGSVPINPADLYNYPHSAAAAMAAINIYSQAAAAAAAANGNTAVRPNPYMAGANNPLASQLLLMGLQNGVYPPGGPGALPRWSNNPALHAAMAAAAAAGAAAASQRTNPMTAAAMAAAAAPRGPTARVANAGRSRTASSPSASASGSENLKVEEVKNVAEESSAQSEGKTKAAVMPSSQTLNSSKEIPAAGGVDKNQTTVVVVQATASSEGKSEKKLAPSTVKQPQAAVAKDQVRTQVSDTEKGKAAPIKNVWSTVASSVKEEKSTRLPGADERPCPDEEKVSMVGESDASTTRDHVKSPRYSNRKSGRGGRGRDGGRSQRGRYEPRSPRYRGKSGKSKKIGDEVKEEGKKGSYASSHPDSSHHHHHHQKQRSRNRPTRNNPRSTSAPTVSSSQTGNDMKNRSVEEKAHHVGNEEKAKQDASDPGSNVSENSSSSSPRGRSSRSYGHRHHHHHHNSDRGKHFKRGGSRRGRSGAKNWRSHDQLEKVQDSSTTTRGGSNVSHETKSSPSQRGRSNSSSSNHHRGGRKGSFTSRDASVERTDKDKHVAKGSGSHRGGRGGGRGGGDSSPSQKRFPIRKRGSYRGRKSSGGGDHHGNSTTKEGGKKSSRGGSSYRGGRHRGGRGSRRTHSTNSVSSQPTATTTTSK